MTVVYIMFIFFKMFTFFNKYFHHIELSSIPTKTLFYLNRSALFLSLYVTLKILASLLILLDFSLLSATTTTILEP